MAEHEQIRQLISVYIDGEASHEEKQMVEQHLAQCDDCRRYYNELRQLSTALHQCSDEDLSPDLERNMNRKLGEGREMKTNKVLLTASVSLVTLIIAIGMLQIYVKRGIQGRLRSATEDIGEQYSVGQGNIRPATHVAGRTSTVSQTAGRSDAQIGWQDVAVMEKSDHEVEARIKAAADYLGSQDKNKKQGRVNQYEPYYLKSESGVARDQASIDERRGFGYQTSQFDASQWAAAVGFGTPQATGPDYGVVSGRPCLVSPEAALDKTPAYGSKGVLREDLKIWVEEETRQEQFNTEEYDRIYENEFLTVTENPLSTFSIDVDTASYSNIRRFLNNRQRPPKDAVRIEEMINYFVYDYPQPQGEDPFSINTEAANCPWNPVHQLVLIGLQGKELPAAETPPSNLVFLIDVSGSMNQPDKLPLLKNAFKMMTKQLRSEERVSIVTYAGAAGLVLEGANGGEKQKILDAIERMQAGGCTAGGQGIRLAYDVARRNFIPGGNNRVILATDGDFNVGVSSDAEMVRLIEAKRREGIFLTVLGFGTGNYKDAKMEKIADKGNGSYYYIDTIREGQKVLVHELGSTLFTIAKDVKLQIEFNPQQVKAYRLIGYENRILAKEDFNDDTKDAGELGAGHTVTALYEIVPADSVEEFASVDPLKYQHLEVRVSTDLLTVKLRYKKPHEETSKLLSRVLTCEEIKTGNASQNLRWASAVAEFGLLLRDSRYKGNSTYRQVLDAARQAKGVDQWGYRSEFINLVEQAQALR